MTIRARELYTPLNPPLPFNPAYIKSSHLQRHLKRAKKSQYQPVAISPNSKALNNIFCKEYVYIKFASLNVFRSFNTSKRNIIFLKGCLGCWSQILAKQLAKMYLSVIMYTKSFSKFKLTLTQYCSCLKKLVLIDEIAVKAISIFLKNSAL